MNIEFRLNGRPVQVDTDGSRQLLWLLRTDLGMTGAKYGCGAGNCGACAVLVNGEVVRSCLIPVRSIEGADIVTIEGLAQGDALHPIQQAFVEHAALQCGFCTPGMILTAHALLSQTPRPTREQIIAHMDQNLCRCGAHRRILLALEAVAAQGGVR